MSVVNLLVSNLITLYDQVLWVGWPHQYLAPSKTSGMYSQASLQDETRYYTWAFKGSIFFNQKKKTKNPKNPTKQRNWTVSKKKVCESQICSVIYVHMTISVLWTVSCEIFGGLKGSLSFLCKIGITDLNYHCQQELSFMWTCNLRGGHRRIKFWVCWGRRMVQGWMLEPQVLHVIWFLKMIW